MLYSVWDLKKEEERKVLNRTDHFLSQKDLSCTFWEGGPGSGLCPSPPWGEMYMEVAEAGVTCSVIHIALTSSWVREPMRHSEAAFADTVQELLHGGDHRGPPIPDTRLCSLSSSETQTLFAFPGETTGKLLGSRPAAFPFSGLASSCFFKGLEKSKKTWKT